MTDDIVGSSSSTNKLDRCLVLTIVVTIVLGHGRRVDLQAEQMAIYEENDGGKLPLTWAQTRRMPITHLVRPDV